MTTEKLCGCSQNPCPIRFDSIGVAYCRDCGGEWGRPICSCGNPFPRYGRDIGICPEEVHYRDDKNHQPMSGPFVGWEKVEVSIGWPKKPNKLSPLYWWWRLKRKFRRPQPGEGEFREC